MIPAFTEGRAALGVMLPVAAAGAGVGPLMLGAAGNGWAEAIGGAGVAALIGPTCAGCTGCC